MNLSASILEDFDSCPRKYALLRDYEPTFMSATAMLYAGLEAGLIESDPGEGAKYAIRQLAARVDLDAKGLSGLSGVRHVGLLAEILAVALRRVLGPLEPVEPVRIGEHVWHSGLFHSGVILHKIVLISHYDDDSLRSFAHRWGVVGELAAMKCDIALTAVVIGQSRGGRRHSHWTKAYQHPVSKELRFAPRDRKAGFTRGWSDVWREQTQITAEKWLETMQSDGVLGDLILTRKVPWRSSDARVVCAERDLVQIAPRLAEASYDSPMRRAACDQIGAVCPLQPYCWSQEPVEMEALAGLFRARETDPQTLDEAITR